MKTASLACALAVVTLCALSACGSGGEDQRTVVAILFDGFSGEMVDAYDTPNLDRMRAEGAWTHHMVPVFPTVSLPNHTSFTTGCLPENHGIVSNRFLDTARGFYDHSGDADWRRDCEGLPEIAERQGIASASIFFAGDRSKERGNLSTHASADLPFDQRPPDLETADMVVEHLSSTAGDRPRLIQVYFKGPDNAAHYNGIDSPETKAAVEESDAAIGKILAAAEASGDEVTVIVGTDHGMAPIEGIVNMAHILEKQSVSAGYASSGASSYIYLTDPRDTDYALQSFAKYDEIEAFAAGSYPDYAQVGSSARVGDLLVVAKPPYAIEDPQVFPKEMTEGIDPAVDWPALLTEVRLVATHGYDPSVERMHGILYAWGSGIAAGKQAGEVPIIDVHPTVAHLLGIEPGDPVDGSVATALLDASP